MPSRSQTDPFGARATLSLGSDKLQVFKITALKDAGLCDVDRFPFSIKVLLESVLRNVDGSNVTEEDVQAVAAWGELNTTARREIPFIPARVLLQDFTGVPALVDLAAMRDAMTRLGGDPKEINPLIPVDLVIDHSVQVDAFGSPDAVHLQPNLLNKFVKWFYSGNKTH